MEDFTSEKNIEQKLRTYKWFIPFMTVLVAALLYWAICLCEIAFEKGYYWVVIPAGIFVHSFFIVVVHDGGHKAITRTKFDRFIMNLGSGVMLLPFYGELFRKYHLIHHANTNSEVDPLWPDFKKGMYSKARWFYILCELVPLAFTLVLIVSGKKKQSAKALKQPSVSIPYILLSILISLVVAYYTRPAVWFIVGTLLSVNVVKLFRHWCEHMGVDLNKETNTYWFPLGMGIGNHEAHHEFPHFSWLTMMIGLPYRKKDTNPFKVLYQILFMKSFSHYKEIKK
jgi:fatty acid desaturase